MSRMLAWISSQNTLDTFIQSILKTQNRLFIQPAMFYLELEWKGDSTLPLLPFDLFPTLWYKLLSFCSLWLPQKSQMAAIIFTKKWLSICWTKLHLFSKLTFSFHKLWYDIYNVLASIHTYVWANRNCKTQPSLWLTQIRYNVHVACKTAY